MSVDASEDLPLLLEGSGLGIHFFSQDCVRILADSAPAHGINTRL